MVWPVVCHRLPPTPPRRPAAVAGAVPLDTVGPSPRPFAGQRVPPVPPPPSPSSLHLPPTPPSGTGAMRRSPATEGECTAGPPLVVAGPRAWDGRVAPAQWPAPHVQREAYATDTPCIRPQQHGGLPPQHRATRVTQCGCFCLLDSQ